jgi:hypothetical protein
MLGYPKKYISKDRLGLTQCISAPATDQDVLRYSDTLYGATIAGSSDDLIQYVKNGRVAAASDGLSQSDGELSATAMVVGDTSGGATTGLAILPTTPQGIKLTNLSEVQRDALSEQEDGLMTYSTSTRTLNLRRSGSWRHLAFHDGFVDITNTPLIEPSKSPSNGDEELKTTYDNDAGKGVTYDASSNTLVVDTNGAGMLSTFISPERTAGNATYMHATYTDFDSNSPGLRTVTLVRDNNSGYTFATTDFELSNSTNTQSFIVYVSFKIRMQIADPTDGDRARIQTDYVATSDGNTIFSIGVLDQMNMNDRGANTVVEKYVSHELVLDFDDLPVLEVSQFVAGDEVANGDPIMTVTEFNLVAIRTKNTPP